MHGGKATDVVLDERVPVRQRASRCPGGDERGWADNASPSQYLPLFHERTGWRPPAARSCTDGDARDDVPHARREQRAAGAAAERRKTLTMTGR